MSSLIVLPFLAPKWWMREEKGEGGIKRDADLKEELLNSLVL